MDKKTAPIARNNVFTKLLPYSEAEETYNLFQPRNFLLLPFSEVLMGSSKASKTIHNT